MEKLIDILLGVALVYGVYALGMKNWDYASETKRKELEIRLQEKGLSAKYYFMAAWQLFLMNLLCGGLFVFYWSYKQWQAVQAGYKSTRSAAPKGSPFLRALFTFITFYQFNAVLNRTCLYMHKRPSLPTVFWGTVLWAGAAAALIPALPLFWRILGGLLFIFAPCALQRRVNRLPKNLPPFRVKAAEIIFMFACWLIWAGIALALK